MELLIQRQIDLLGDNRQIDKRQHADASAHYQKKTNCVSRKLYFQEGAPNEQVRINHAERRGLEKKSLTTSTSAISARNLQ